MTRIRENEFARFELVDWTGEVIANSYSPFELLNYADRQGLEVCSVPEVV